MKIAADDLTRIAGFYEPFEDVDPDGQIIQDWLLRFTIPAHVHYLRGSEAVMQARLQSKNPAIVTIRRTSRTIAVTSEWRIELDGKIFDIKEDPRPDQDRSMLQMLSEG